MRDITLLNRESHGQQNGKLNGHRALCRVSCDQISQKWGYLAGEPYKKYYNISGSLLGCPYFGELPLLSARQGRLVCTNVC